MPVCLPDYMLLNGVLSHILFFAVLHIVLLSICIVCLPSFLPLLCMIILYTLYYCFNIRPEAWLHYWLACLLVCTLHVLCARHAFNRGVRISIADCLFITFHIKVFLASTLNRIGLQDYQSGDVIHIWYNLKVKSLLPKKRKVKATQSVDMVIQCQWSTYCYLTRLISHSGPGQVHSVQGNQRRLQKTRSGLGVLNTEKSRHN